MISEIAYSPRNCGGWKRRRGVRGDGIRFVCQKAFRLQVDSEAENISHLDFEFFSKKNKAENEEIQTKQSIKVINGGHPQSQSRTPTHTHTHMHIKKRILVEFSPTEQK